MKFNFSNGNNSLRHQSIIKEGNIKQLFNLILVNEGISRIALSKKTGLNRSTVTFLIGELVKAGIVEIMGEGDSSSLGRKPIMLRINPGIAQVVAVSLKKKTFTYTLFDLGCNELESFSEDISYKKGCGAKIWESITGRSSHLRPDLLLAICVSIPAQVDNASRSVFLSAIDIKNDCDLVDELKSMRPDIPLMVGNNSSAYVYAEYKYTYAEEIEKMIFFDMSGGVSAGILHNGSVFTAEIGHMSIYPDGLFCECGRRGCLEMYVGREAILRRFKTADEKGKKGVKPANYAAIRKIIEKGDNHVLKTARVIAAEVALGINNVICMFYPKSIKIGGGIEELGEVFLKMVVERINIPGSGGINSENNIQVDFSRLGYNADLKGLSRYFIDRILTITTETENTLHILN